MYNGSIDALHTSVLILHVLGATVIVGTAFVSLVIELKRLTSPQVLTLTELIWKIAGMAMGIQILTGLYLAGSEWGKIGGSPYFWIKMFLFFVVGGTVGVVNLRRFERLKAGRAEDRSDISWAVVGFLTFATIAALGVLIAESTH